MTKFAILATALSSALLLGACASGASDLDTGERIAKRGSDISGYGDAWSEGQQQVRQGEQRVQTSDKSMDRANRQLADAREAVTDAEAKLQAADADRTEAQRLISEGQAKMQRAEADYAAVRAGPSANQTPALN